MKKISDKVIPNLRVIRGLATFELIEAYLNAEKIASYNDVYKQLQDAKEKLKAEKVVEESERT